MTGRAQQGLDRRRYLGTKSLAEADSFVAPRLCLWEFRNIIFQMQIVSLHSATSRGRRDISGRIKIMFQGCALPRRTRNSELSR